MNRLANNAMVRTTRLAPALAVGVALLAVGLSGMVVRSEQAFAQDKDVMKFHHQSSGPKVDYQALLEAASPLADSPEGQALLDACLETYGGIEKLETLQGFQSWYRKAGSTATDEAGPGGTISKSFARGRLYKVVEGDKERILNGSNCWVQDKDTAWPMDDFRYRAELYSYLVLAMPYAAVTERFDEVRYTPDPGKSLGLFYFVKSDSLMIILGVDTGDHLVKATTGVLANEATTGVFVNQFADFRKVEGFTFPHRVTNYSLGMKMGELVLDKVAVNPLFSANEFLPRSPGK